MILDRIKQDNDVLKLGFRTNIVGFCFYKHEKEVVRGNAPKSFRDA
jgi:hypothetical protein